MAEQLATPLRRHFAQVADERQARGQLESVLAATAAMPQRRPWAVRLRWRLEPVSPFGPLAPSRVRLAYAVIALLLVAALAGSLGFGNAVRPRGPFEGTWTSTDGADDSTQTLVVGEGPTPAVHFEDDFSVNCERRGEASTIYIVDGTAEVSDDRMNVHFGPGGCGIKLDPVVWWYDYVASSDTLHDHQGIDWVRVRSSP